jgi:uncharacterized protein (DUF2336 family)
MDVLQSFVKTIEDAMSGNDQEHRTMILRRVTDLFINDSPRLSETTVQVYDQVILKLSREIEFRARIELSDRLADIANAPRQVVRDLAYDDNVLVAAPVLQRSTRIEESDLIRIAQEKGQDHLMALAQRQHLGERVTDVLVVRGNQDVVRSVANNTTAQFSHQGFNTLVQKAQIDPQLRLIISARIDTPPEFVESLVKLAKQKAQQNLGRDLNMDEDLLEEALDRTLGSIAKNSGALSCATDMSGAQQTVQQLANQQELTEKQILLFLEQGKLQEALAAIATLTKIPVDIVVSAYSAKNYDPILLIVKSAKLSWHTFKGLMIAKAGRDLSQNSLSKAFESFEGLTVATAQRVLRFVVMRGKVSGSNAA